MSLAKRTLPTALLIALIPAFALAQGHGNANGAGNAHQHGDATTPYAGFEQRAIKSLSEEDIAQIRQGGGWGLALPAELNGKPGPAHLLELSDELGLTADQIDAITALYQEMRAEAIAAGDRFIAAEAALSTAFAGSDLSQDALRKLLAEAADARAALRFVHLSKHLSTPQMLSADQIRKYQILRGYADDPCAKVPEGHNPAMWRHHNGCE